MDRNITVDQLLTEDAHVRELNEDQTPIDASLQKMLQDQMNRELANHQLYKQMSFVMEQKGFFGFAGFYKLQAMDENGHHRMFSEYLLDRGILPVPSNQAAPKVEGTTPKELASAGLEREKETTKEIWAIRKKADDVGDAATHHWIQRLVAEQIEEEKTFQDMLTRLELIGNDTAALLEYDEEIGEDSRYPKISKY